MAKQFDVDIYTFSSGRTCKIKTKLKKFTLLEGSWAFIICLLTEILSGYDSEPITEKFVKKIIKANMKNEDFKLSYKYWLAYTNLLDAENTLISTLISRNNGVATDYSRFSEFIDDPLSYIEYIQFGHQISYENAFEEMMK